QVQAPAKVKGTLALGIASGNTNLLIERSNGTITMHLSAALVGYSQTVQATISISAPMNPSGVNLSQGATGGGGTVPVTLSAVGYIDFQISTPSSNSQSGTLTYTVTLSTTDSNVTIAGSPMTVTVKTNP
ncbi:MAG TPA: hypothetical protein VN633_24315, partial [Bryobacteraceae bacterium]|nr:hypothetical protein [Bryobacteraceae bacterium]